MFLEGKPFNERRKKKMNNKILGNAIELARRTAKVFGRNVYVATGTTGFEVTEKKPQFCKRFYVVGESGSISLVNNTFGRRY
jgi:hypothetical protein